MSSSEALDDFSVDMALMQSIMQRPFFLRPDQAIKGGLRAIHVNRVLAALKKISTSGRSDEIGCGDAAAFHTILFHLAPTALTPPPRKGEDGQASSNFLRDARKLYGESWGVKLAKLRSSADEAAAHRAAAVDARVLPSRLWRSKPAPTSFAAPPPPPTPPTPAEAELWHRASCRLMLARGTHARYGMSSPVRIIEGHVDLLTKIAEYAGIGELWIAEPPRKELFELRRICVVQHREIHHLRAMLEQALASHSMACRHEGWARNREAAAYEACDAMRERSVAVAKDLEEALARIQQLSAENAKLNEQLHSLRSELRGERKERSVAEHELREKILEIEKKTESRVVDALRDQDREIRAERVRLANERDASTREMQDAQELAAQLSTSLERVRSCSKAKLLEEIKEQEGKIKELIARRTTNQLTIKEANLWKQAAKQSTEAAAKQRSRLNEFWASEKEADRELEKAQVALAEVQKTCEEQKVKLKEQQAEISCLKAIAEPGKERFKTKGHFSATVDLSIVQVLSLGIARKKVPQLYGIFARLFGIKLPGREIMVPGPVVDGKRTFVKRFVFHTPGATHCKEMASVMYQINKLQVGQWLLEYMNSEETSCCYLADGAEAQQLERLGQVLARRIEGKLQLMALDVNTVESKTGEAQAAAFKQSIEEAVKLMEEAGLVDQRAAELLRRFLPTCSCNDRAANGRKGARLVLGLADGDDDPTCAEHALVNILEEGRKAMDLVLRRLMEITEAQAEADAEKIKAMRTCVGWFSSPVCALIYQVAKYCAMCSTKGYAIGRKFLEWMEARLADTEDQSELLGHSEDLLAICGSRMYVFFLDAAVTERLLSTGSLLTYLEEESDMGTENGGKLRASILKGASSTCMAGVRAMALICDTVFWKMIRAVKPSAEKHVLDVLPRVWPTAHTFFKQAAASPAAIIDGSLYMELGIELPVTRATPSQGSRAARHEIDMERIRRKAVGDPIVEQLLSAAFEAMAKATANHAAEWLPAGLVATDGSITTEGKLCAAKITPELRAKYDAFCATSTPVERLHAIGRFVDDRGKLQRVDSRAGVQLGIFNGQAAYLADMTAEQLEKTLNVSRPAARRARRVTIKQQLIAAGRAKRAEREAKLSGKRARKLAKAAEKARLEKVTLATTYSQLKVMAIPELQDQLRAFKLQGKSKLKFALSQKDRAAYCRQLQALLLEAHGTQANDLDGNDSGCGADGVVRKLRASKGGGGKKRAAGTCELNGYIWQADEEFDIERLIDKKIEYRSVGKVRNEPILTSPSLPAYLHLPIICLLLVWCQGKHKSTKEIIYYKVLWEGFPPDVATWEPESAIHDDFIDEYEATVEAEAELEAEEEAEDEEDAMEEE